MRARRDLSLHPLVNAAVAVRVIRSLTVRFRVRRYCTERRWAAMSALVSSPPRSAGTPALDPSALGALAARMQAGDVAAFDAFVEAITPLLYRLCLRLAHDPQDAEDAVQETVVRVWQRIGTLRDPQAALAWTCRIARNVATDAVRAKTRRAARSLDAPVGPVNASERTLLETLVSERGDPAALLQSAEARALIHRALARVPEKFRVVLQLREIDGLTYDEIAVALGVRPGTVESRLHRARKKLAHVVRDLRPQEKP